MHSSVHAMEIVKRLCALWLAKSNGIRNPVNMHSHNESQKKKHRKNHILQKEIRNRIKLIFIKINAYSKAGPMVWFLYLLLSSQLLMNLRHIHNDFPISIFTTSCQASMAIDNNNEVGSCLWSLVEDWGCTLNVPVILRFCLIINNVSFA